jgi:hypothetical protein
MLAHLKRWWMRFAHRLGQIQTALILALVYVLVIGPTSLVLRGIGRRDLLELRTTNTSSFAHEKHAIPTDRERCERQF